MSKSETGISRISFFTRGDNRKMKNKFHGARR